MNVFLNRNLNLAPDGDGAGSGDTGGNSGNQDGNSNDNAQNQGNEGDSGNQSSNNAQNSENFPGEDDPMWSDTAKVKNYVQSLRKENAKYRTENKSLKTEFNDLNTRFGTLEGGLKKALGLEDDKMTPEDQVKGLSQTVDALQFNNALGEIAIENGIQGGKAFNYFKFLVSEASENLEENEEITDEQILGFVDQAKKAFGKPQTGNSSTTVNQGKDGFGNPDPNSGNKLTVEQFSKMTLAEKGDLYGKNPSLYNSLMSEAREKRLI